MPLGNVGNTEMYHSEALSIHHSQSSKNEVDLVQHEALKKPLRIRSFSYVLLSVILAIGQEENLQN